MTRMFRSLIVPTLAFVAIASAAKADYSYNFVAGSATPITGVTYTGLPGTTVGNGPSIPPVLSLAFSSAAVPGSFALSFQETITSTTLGTQTFTISGLLTIALNALGTTNGSILTSFTATSVTSTPPVGGPGYTVPVALVNYLPTNTTGTPAQIGIAIIPNAAVPEPASVVMLGLGLVGTAGFAARRRRLARA